KLEILDSRTHDTECLSTLLRFEVREFDHLGPLYDFVGNELAQVARRASKGRAAQIGEPRLDVGIREARIDLLIELVDDFGRHMLGGKHALPSPSLVSGRN